jgi:uncharacterized membrane protein YraQ (UPF0718 family)
MLVCLFVRNGIFVSIMSMCFSAIFVFRSLGDIFIKLSSSGTMFQ